jgi:hypothetical protein
MKRLFVAMPYGVRKAPLDYEEPDKTCVIDFDAVWDKRAHELQPEDLYPLVTVGAMCGALGKVGEAKEWYQKLQATCESCA